MSRTGQKHLIECRCILPQFRKSPTPVFHKFTVFSVISNDVVEPKYVQCNNCNLVHKVYDLCKSEILPGRDELRNVVTKEEVAFSLPEDVRNLLETYDCDLPIWEHIAFVLEEEQWEQRVILTREKVEEETVGKSLVIKGPNKFKLENYINREIVG